MKDLRSLSLPNMKPSGSQSPYIVTPVSERVEHRSLGRRESTDLLVRVWLSRLRLALSSFGNTPMVHISNEMSLAHREDRTMNCLNDSVFTEYRTAVSFTVVLFDVTSHSIGNCLSDSSNQNIPPFKPHTADRHTL